MPFATRADLLARSNALHLVQLAVPADMAMPPESGLRIAIDGGDLSGYTAGEQLALAAALARIDQALGDADELIVGYGIPAATQTSLLARIGSTLALYFLHDVADMPKELDAAYKGAVDLLKGHQRGDVDLIPALATDPVVSDDLVQFDSAPRRYGSAAGTEEDW